ncbi:aminotransferase class IV [Actinokineospora iranica]|uniref:Branched-chain amino acid aminotransferase/4-amino-4-deoxychorismate lyase n=1 Tax=Actinokineospora iranica TaxID=1271860 RepID=A0A1G6KAF0_9PSEU|nr:aminotransferase class IV [Actinokineospora iranica]SDC28042.1 Branched-chain amino acid aminotransferase/4-amino-4-deoxychorismate lyase [Actinokineospora iranica]
MSTQNDLQPNHPRPALVSYGHFTALRVEDGRARGLARHLERLDRDSRIVFGRGIDEGQVRAAIRAAVAGVAGPAVVKVTVHAPAFDRRRPEADLDTEIMVTAEPMPGEVPPPLRVRTAGYQRDLPQVKHVGTFGLLYQRRLARQAGYDDVLFVAPDGQVSEGCTWNVCFLDGDKVVWPNSPALPGVGMALIQSGLNRGGMAHETRPVLAADLAGFRAAFATNALTPVRPITQIDDVKYEIDADAAARLLRCHDLTAGERV